MEPDILNFAEEQSDGDAALLPFWKILIADDEPSVHLVTKLALGDFVFEGRRLELLSAYGEADVKTLLAQNPDVALILLDVVMDTASSGFDLVRYIRNELKNNEIRIIMRTGQSGNAPEDRIIINYDINDFKDKTELTVAKLRTTLISSLRAYNHLRIIAEEKTKLAQSKTYFGDILNSLATVLITVDAEMKVVLWNHQAEIWSGVSSRDALNRHLFEAAPWLEPLGPLFLEVFSSGHSDERRDVPVSLPSSPGFVRLAVHPLIAESGRELIIHLEDVTVSRRREEQALRNQRLGVFSTLAESFGTELQSILMDLRSQNSPKETGIKRLEALVRRLPAPMTRPPTPRQPLDWFEFVQKTAQSPKIEGRVFLEPCQDSAIVWATSEELQNLCDRLLESAGDGTKIQVRLGRSDKTDVPFRLLAEGGDRVYWKLKAEIQPSQHDAEQTKLWTVDLTSVYNTAEMLGGFVDALTDAHGGMTVLVWLPEPLISRANPAVPNSAWQDTGLVLVCDDEPMMLQVAASILKRFGYTVLTATDGSEALEMVRKNKQRLKLVVLDLLLPGISGLEIFRKIHKETPLLPVILSSGFGRGRPVEEALKEGAAGFLQKPFGLEKLGETVRVLFQSGNHASG